MKKECILLLFACIVFSGSAQNFGQQTSHWNASKSWAKTDLLQKSKKVIGDNLDNDVEGSLYFSEVYAPGTLLFEGKELERNMLYRYEAYSDIMEVKLENGEEDYLAQSPKLDVIIGDEHYSYVQFYDDSKNEMAFGYMIVIDENEQFSLYDRKIKKLRPGKKATTSMSADLEAKLLDNETLYFRLSEDKFAKSFPKSKNELFKMFPEQKTELKKFLKSQKINLDDPTDVERVLEFCL